VEGGFGYGVIGADLHVFADRGPVYLLRQCRPEPKPDTAWLLSQPSRMLNARYAIVAFTGRQQEHDELVSWRDAPRPRLSARWLHGPGGQGKTRLASAFAQQSAAANWKVITATHGPGSVLPPPGSQDLRLHEAAGVLLIVDYADRWPGSHLAWLFSNALLHQHIPARLLLIARAAHGWPAVRAELGTHQAETTDQLLAFLPDDPGGRQRMFEVARETFANHYGIPRSTAIQPPGPLGHPDFGLTLAVHMAALVAIDAAAHGLRPPEDMAGLTAYLLDRERQHWTKLNENHREGLEFATPPNVMARTVFTAVLTGAVSHMDGVAILTQLDLGIHAEQALVDHSVCYPPTGPAGETVLEPLYPDRLAEDFLALTLPGHSISAHPPDPWTTTAAATLLTSRHAEVSPAHLSRSLVFLAAAAVRWPHVGSKHLNALLRHEPALAVRAGGAALTALAELPTVPVDLLEVIASHFPQGRRTDLASGIAAITRRVANQRLAATQDPLVRARTRDELARRLSDAGLHQEALATAQDALSDWRYLAQTDPAAHEPGLAQALGILGDALREVGLREEAVPPAEESVALYRKRAAADPVEYRPYLAGAIAGLARCLGELGQWDEGVALQEEAVATYRQVATAHRAAHQHNFAAAVVNLGTFLRQVGRLEETLAPLTQAAEAYRRLAAASPGTHEPELAKALRNLAMGLLEMGQYEDAVENAEESVAISRRLAAANPVAHEFELADALNILGLALRQVGRTVEALSAAREATEVFRQLAAANPAAYDPFLATAVLNLSSRLGETALGEVAPGGEDEALALADEGVRMFRRLASSNPAAYEHLLAKGLHGLSFRLAQVGRLHESLTVAEEGIAIRRRLAAANPQANAGGLAGELGNLGISLLQVTRRHEALAVIEESIELYRPLAAANPAEHEPDLGRMLWVLARASMDMPSGVERASAAIAEALMIFRKWVNKRPEAVRPYLEDAENIHRALNEPSARPREEASGRIPRQQGVSRVSARGHRGTDIETEATLPFEQAALGTVVLLKLKEISREIKVRMPRSAYDGQKIRLSGQGTPGVEGGPAGDLYVTIRVQPHKVFDCDGDRLIITVPVSASEATCGAEIQVPVLGGRPITVRIPKGTPHGRTFRVRGHGLRRADGTSGDLLVSVELVADDADVAAMRADLIAKAAMP
jgi:tetratricopeptide (TPR) repeat protein